MSRIGKQPIALPSGVTATVDADVVTVKGPKGELHQRLSSVVGVVVTDGVVSVTVQNQDEKKNRALWGLSRVLVANMVKGVSEGFSKSLEVQGVGYRVQTQGRKVVLHLGYSHPVEYELPTGIEAKSEKNILIITGVDKQLVGNTAARIRSFRKPEPYKGKGIRYVGEVVRRKAGKVVKTSEG